MSTDKKNKNEVPEEAAGKNEAAKRVEKQADAQPPAKKTKKKWNTAKLKRGGLSTLMTIVFIVLVVGVNLLFSLLSDRFPSMNVDLTAQGLNTLSEEAIEAAKNVQYDTTISILMNEEDARQGKYDNPARPYSQVANLAERLKEVNGKISVEYVDLDKNPNYTTNYPDDTLGLGVVIVKSEKRHRVLGISDLFVSSTNSSTGETSYTTQVDGAMANALNQVNLENMPLVAVSTANNVELDTAALEVMLKERGYEVEHFDLLTEEVPENTQVVLLGAPTSDLTKEQVQKLRDYLGSPTADASRSLFYIANLANGTNAPVLQAFLEEWGVQIEPGVVIETDTNNALPIDDSGIPYGIVAVNGGEILTDNSYSYLISPYTSPLRQLFTYNDNVSVKKLWVSADTAYVATESLQENPETGEQILATLSAKSVKVEDSYTSENVVVFGSPTAFMKGLGNNDNYGNKGYITDLFSHLTGVDNQTISVPQVETFTLDIVASSNTLLTLSLGLFTVAIPLLILIIGLVLFFRRRHL